MLAYVTGDALQLIGHLHDFLRVFIGVDEFAQQGLYLECLLQRHARFEGNQFRQLVGQGIGLALHPGHITHNGLGRHGTEGDDLRYRILAIQLGNMRNNAVATLHAEVDVEIRHRYPLRIQEAFEQQVILKWVDICDA